LAARDPDADGALPLHEVTSVLSGNPRMLVEAGASALPPGHDPAKFRPTPGPPHRQFNRQNGRIEVVGGWSCSAAPSGISPYLAPDRWSWVGPFSVVRAEGVRAPYGEVPGTPRPASG
jgi:hypothetical protein